MGAHSLEGRAPMEHSRQSSLWVLGPQPTAVSTGATAPSLTLPTRGQIPATHCSCLSQVRNLFLAHALLFLFSRYVAQLFATLWTAARQTPLSFTIFSTWIISLVVVKGLSYLSEAMIQLCRATQAQWIIVKSPDKTWSPGGGNGSPFQYSCLENPWRVPCFTIH